MAAMGSIVGADFRSVHLFEDCQEALSAQISLVLSHHELVQLEGLSGAWY